MMSVRQGFTLIELSIVLVIIGLIVGGVLVGQDLIRAAEIRSLISQIESYDAAAGAFRVKYNGLPGDLKNGQSFGFVIRGSNRGEGDGNGIIEGLKTGAVVCADATYGCYQCGGEGIVFWRDLSTAGLIPDSFATASETATSGSVNIATTPTLRDFYPAAKVKDNIFYTYSNNGMNFYGITSGSGSTINGVNCTFLAARGMQVKQAAAVDAKMDDGDPQSGKVAATYLFGGSGIYWSHGNATAPGTAAITPDATTCYDNNNTAGVQPHYSMGVNDGAGVNCALSIRPVF